MVELDEGVDGAIARLGTDRMDLKNHVGHHLTSTPNVAVNSTTPEPVL